MYLKHLAEKLLIDKVTNAGDASVAESALGELFNDPNKFDLAELVDRFTSANSDIASKAQSWLGDGTNSSISAIQVVETLGTERVQAVAAKLGVTPEEASKGLSEMLPQLIDLASHNGNLLYSVSGNSKRSSGGIFSGLASKLLKQS